MTMLVVGLVAAVVLGGVGLAVAFVMLRGRRGTPAVEDDFAEAAPPPARVPSAAPPPPLPVPQAVAPPVVHAPPAPAAPSVPVEAAPEVPGGPVQIEKLRIAEVGLVLRAWGLTVGADELLAFATEGFAERGRSELVLYVRRAACPDADVVRALKRFAGLALLIMERVEPVKMGEVLKVPGEIGSVPLGGYLAVEPAEPGPVPFHGHVVLIGLPRRVLSGEPAAIRAALTADGGGRLWLTTI